MKVQEVNFATARIKGLTNQPYYFEHRCFYAWNIKLETTLEFNDILIVNVGQTEEGGKIFCNQLKENFNKAHIYEGDRIVVIFKDDGKVIAIGNKGEDVWIDITDNLSKKSFAELDIEFTSLKVY